MKQITDQEKGLLAIAVTVQPYLNEQTIVAAGRLMERGWVRAESDYDGLLIIATEAGEKAAKRLGLVVREITKERANNGWERTPLGLSLSQPV